MKLKKTIAGIVACTSICAMMPYSNIVSVNKANAVVSETGEDEIFYSNGRPYTMLLYDNFYCWVFEDRVAVMGCKDKTITEAVIPSEINGLPVTEMGEYLFEDCTNLKSVEIPETITKYGIYMFKNCKSLTSFTIPSNMTQIPPGTFQFCENLETVTLHDNIKVVGYECFYYCKSLRISSLPDSVITVGSRAFTGCDSITSFEISENVTNDDVKWMFGYCNNLQEINVNENNPVYTSKDGVLYSKDLTSLIAYPDGREGEFTVPEHVTTLPAGAFASTVKLTKLIIPETVTSIGRSVCNGSIGLQSVVLPENITEIGDYWFIRCESLTDIKIPDSVTAIGEASFNECHSLKNIKFPEGLKTIGEGAFAHCELIEEIVFPDGLTTIGDTAFSRCESLGNFVLPDGLTTIGSGAFSQCRSITSVVIPDSVTSLGSSSFASCSSLKEFQFSKNIEYIMDSTFEGCSGLVEITVPANIRSIGREAFCECSSLKKLIIENPICTLYEAKNTVSSVAFNEDGTFNGTIYSYRKVVRNSNAYNYAVAYGKNFMYLEDVIVSEKTGDSNGDNEITISDAVALTAYIAGSDSSYLPMNLEEICDVHDTGNGINSSDAFMIQQYVTGVIDEL